jgi:hypothetical protein
MNVQTENEEQLISTLQTREKELNIHISVIFITNRELDNNRGKGTSDVVP